jgi:hypothetical protein
MKEVLCMKKYFVAECIKNYTGEYTEIDCDDTTISDCDFVTGQQYRVKEIRQEWVIYPDNGWDGTYRYDYINVKEFGKYFKVVRELGEEENLNE